LEVEKRQRHTHNSCDSLNWANENVAGSNRQYAIGAKVIAGNNCVTTGPTIVAMVVMCGSEVYHTRKKC
jgi:hypothetical protein